MSHRASSPATAAAPTAALALRVLLLASAQAVCFFLGQPGVAQTAARPNIIFILTDDMRADAMGCAGNRIIQTPNLDRLADGGFLFGNMFCTTSICATSRASFLTGQYASRHGIDDFAKPLSAEAFAGTFPALLRKAGYHTGFVGKWGLGGKLPEDEFDFWTGYSGQGRYFEKGDPEHLTTKLGRQALEFVDQAASHQPFLMCMSSKAPHVQDGDPRPFQPDPRFDGLYADVTIPVPRTATEAAFDALPEFTRTSEGRTRWQQRFATPAMYQESVKDYYRLVTGVDRVVGELLDRIGKLGLADHTVIIFTSDNGFFLGERGLAGKWLMYEESIRIPLLIRHPGLPRAVARARIEEMALSIDIAPTILDFAGVQAPPAMQGRSLKPLMTGRAPDWRDDWFYEHHYGHKGRIPRTEGVRTTRWKYTRYLDAEPPYEELFDLRNDPLEQHNLAAEAEYARTLEQMRQRWRELARAVR